MAFVTIPSINLKSWISQLIFFSSCRDQDGHIPPLQDRAQELRVSIKIPATAKIRITFFMV